MYQIKKINNVSEIESCEKFEISNYQWRNMRSPKAYGWAGVMEEQGIYIKMVCEEKDPMRECTTYHEKVCNDSGMEAFFAFLEEGEDLTNNAMYINFEVNANAMLYAAYGRGRKDRKFIDDVMYEKCQCKTEILEDKWIAKFFVPLEFLNTICDFERFLNGEEFYCNFYKISETKDIEHYGSYKKIDSETPNFHLPVSFSTAKVVD